MMRDILLLPIQDRIIEIAIIRETMMKEDDNPDLGIKTRTITTTTAIIIIIIIEGEMTASIKAANIPTKKSRNHVLEGDTMAQTNTCHSDNN